MNICSQRISKNLLHICATNSQIIQIERIQFDPTRQQFNCSLVTFCCCCWFPIKDNGHTQYKKNDQREEEEKK